MSLIEIIGVVCGAVAGSSVLTAWITSHYNKKTVDATAIKTNAEAVKTNTDAKTDIAESTLKWAEILTRRIDGLELKLEGRDQKIMDLQIEITAVKTELRLYKEGAIHYAVITPSTQPTKDPS